MLFHYVAFAPSGVAVVCKFPGCRHNDCMINKLPRWVEIGGFALAFIAGSVNAIALLGFKHEAVSHLTGTATVLSLQIANLEYAEIVHLLLVIASFLLGAAFSGFVIGNTALSLGRRYSFALLVESALLFFAAVLLHDGNIHGHLLASAACGLQNAMTSTYSGAVVRTTHVSGLFTDLGIMLGLWLRGQSPDKRRVILYMTLIAGFIFGGIAGAALFKVYFFKAILFSSFLTFLLAVAHLAYWHSARKKHV